MFQVSAFSRSYFRLTAFCIVKFWVMRVTVEFFGIPRIRAGRADWELHLPDPKNSATLAEILNALAEEFPILARDCIEGGRLRDGYIANVDGNRFVSDPAAEIANGQHLLILSADAGG